MITKGKIQSIFRGMSGGYAVTLNLECNYEELMQIEQDELSVELKKYRGKRSLDANAYFHVLVGKIAEVIKHTNSYVKNDLIAQYGAQEAIDGRNVYVTTQLEPEIVQEQTAYHWVHIDTKVKGDKTFYSYMVMRGSHTYDTKEMSKLIDGAIYEAKRIGIETLPPDMLERMVGEWGKK